MAMSHPLGADTGSGASARTGFASSGDVGTSAVSWGAILAGAAGAAALSLILLILGVGLGMSSVSPWAQSGLNAGTFGLSTVLWLTFTQLAASGMGGYLAGRLRTRWASVHTDEVYFRDTAHGFLAWAVSSLATAAMLGSAIGSIVGGAAQAGASMVGGAVSAATSAGGAAMGSSDRDSSGPMSYYTDMLLRRGASATPAGAAASDAAAAPASASPAGPAPTAEIGRIFANAVRAGNLAPDDAQYLGQLVAQRTGTSPADAEKRVNDTFTRMQTALKDAQATAKDAADKARKASAYAALWLFVSMLAGAFVASWAATFGGRRRDF